jgi:hypothetical protein
MDSGICSNAEPVLIIHQDWWSRTAHRIEKRQGSYPSPLVGHERND